MQVRVEEINKKAVVWLGIGARLMTARLFSSLLDRVIIRLHHTRTLENAWCGFATAPACVMLIPSGVEGECARANAAMSAMSTDQIKST